jgi:hypothetical protein
VLSPFDIRFFRELTINVESQQADFRQKIASAKSFEEIQYWLGYYQALDDILADGTEIERNLTSGKD